MSAGKIGCLVLYAALAVLAAAMAGSRAGDIALWVILALVVVHAVEVAVFSGLARRASGSLPGHLFSVFLFGYFHAKEMRATVDARG